MSNATVPEADELVRIEGLAKSYQSASEEVQVLSNVDFKVKTGDSIAILGASGSGKTTLLQIVGTLDSPGKGRVELFGKDIKKLNVNKRAQIRNSKIGFVFQFHHLLPEFNAAENVAMPGIIAGMSRKKAMLRACELLEKVGLGSRVMQRVGALSGGERQRAAIARAIFRNPLLILADEPTGNLDEATGTRVADLLVDLNNELGTALVVVTHNLDLAARMKTNLVLHGGELCEK